jgi:hypothetical protein
MGAYLSEPILEKHSTDENGEFLSFGASSMQGWRVSQEVSFFWLLLTDGSALVQSTKLQYTPEKILWCARKQYVHELQKRKSRVSELACFLVLKFYRKQNAMNQDIR